MRVYSDTLTFGDLLEATPRGVNVELLSSIPLARVRSHGWNVQLRDYSSRRHLNTGTHGAGEPGAASYDQHGEWMAALFAIDPQARIAHWDGVVDFERGTQGRYSAVAT